MNEVHSNHDQPGKIQQIVGVYDALSATIANAHDFDWLHVGGYNLAGAHHATPDVGLYSVLEHLDVVRAVVDCTDRPVLVDGDDGFGNYLNVMRLVRDVERTGAKGIHLEDQVLPKKCGHMAGKKVITAAAFVSKIKAFVDTRKSSEFLLFARTDAIAAIGFEEAIERANRYFEAGADILFIEAPESLEQAEAIPKLVNGPVLYNWVFAGRSPLIPPGELQRLGYDYYLQADVLYAVAHALQAYFRELGRSGTYGDNVNRMLKFDEFNELVGLSAVLAAERNYEP